jgi:hypothetical protein
VRPEGERVWRKAARRALRGIDRGRRATHRSECQQHRRGSTWHRRHPQVPVVQPGGEQCTCLRQRAPWFNPGGRS